MFLRPKEYNLYWDPHTTLMRPHCWEPHCLPAQQLCLWSGDKWSSISAVSPPCPLFISTLLTQSSCLCIQPLHQQQGLPRLSVATATSLVISRIARRVLFFSKCRSSGDPGPRQSPNTYQPPNNHWPTCPPPRSEKVWSLISNHYFLFHYTTKVNFVGLHFVFLQRTIGTNMFVTIGAYTVNSCYSPDHQ